MTKEELEKEARINLKRRFGEFFPQLTISYVMGAEPRERRIEELEKACEETQELLDKQIEATYKLDKENAELKDYRLNTVAKQQTEMSKYALNLEHKLSWYDDQLTKAKEIIKKLKALYLSPVVTNDDVKRQDEILAEAEQFLNSEV